MMHNVIRDVVNEEDQVTGQATKEEIEAQRLICRVCFIMLVNKDGELMLQRRSANKRAYPLYWSGAAAGHLIAGESYEQGATRELREELGIAAELDFVGKFFSEEDREMVGVLLGFYDGAPLKVEPMEVDRVEYFTPERLRSELPEMKVTSFVERSLPLVLPRLSRYRTK